MTESCVCLVESGPQPSFAPAEVLSKLVRAAEDEPFTVNGWLATPDAVSLLRLAVRRDDARRGGGGGFDVVFASGLAAVKGPGPADCHCRRELVPGVRRGSPLIAELGGPPQQQILEGGQPGVQPGRGLLQSDRRLPLAKPGGHQRRVRRQVPRAELQPDRHAAHLPVVELEARGELQPVVHVRADAGLAQPGRITIAPLTGPRSTISALKTTWLYQSEKFSL